MRIPGGETGWRRRAGKRAWAATSCSSGITRGGANSRERREGWAWNEPFGGKFAWVVPPVLNRYTRIAVEMCAAQGLLRVTGYETVPGFDLPQAVTLPCEVRAALTETRAPALAS